MTDDQVLTVAQMQAAEQAIFDAGTSIETLMDIAGSGAADWIRRVAAGRSVTVLCGPGNNGGDGYVIARRLGEAGNKVEVVAPMAPATDAARNAASLFKGRVRTSGGAVDGDVLVDCLFGSGLTRALSGEHALLLRDLAERHSYRVAVDLPSGVESNTGAMLNERLPEYDLTLALGAWKFAHWRLPARAMMGARRLVPIGVENVDGAVRLVGRPNLSAPALDSHKYRRGLCAVVAGAMPGAARLACEAAMRGGAGYVQLAGKSDSADASIRPDLVVRSEPIEVMLNDSRISAVLVGPGLGRDDAARARLRQVLARGLPIVVDADGLMLLEPGMTSEGQEVVLTPHDGELETLCKSFAVIADGRMARAQVLAKASGAVVVAKGPDTVIAAPDGRTCLLPPASSWLSVAGSGDVLAGIAASRLANGCEAFVAACEAVWLHSAAARHCQPPFTASDLAHAVSRAYASAL